ncbi:restriction endonuclease S subunit [Bifidobacterium longum subsp. longum]|uniref:restriction endonuclease subunit S n=1 Tax=Bifidobacterium longum TaxID=216816 RepID=UPI00103A7EA7|nr:restriction endonuclease S subunit [Bifidobacterium longum subsp. longum]TCF36350.1 restriction endonuclease S subunit [Bifidobacterium longum subsp. longum]
MTEQAKVPAIRFAGFTDPWEQRKLGELALTYSGGTPSAGNSAYYGGEIPFIRSAEIDCDSTELSLTVAGLNNSSAKLVDKGMVLYAMYGATSGEVAISKIKGAINQAILAMDASDMAANRFIAYWLRRQKKSITETFLQGGQGNLSGAIIKELGIPQPSLDEQRQIGSFFSNLDDLITLHQRKYDKLVIFKKSMLEKMFPKDGESVPEIRFAGFTDPWEQRKASEVFQIVDDRGHPTLPVLSATQNQGMIYRDDSGRYIGHDESNEIGYKRVLPGDFVVHLRSFQGGFAHSQYEGITSPAYTVFRAKEPTSHSDRFWKHWFMSEHFIAGLSTVTYGIRDGRSISVDEFMNTFLAFPAVEEQAAISRLFDYLDDLITLHQRKLELLQNIKKSLLDKMFV